MGAVRRFGRRTASTPAHSCRADDGPHVVDVFNAVEEDQERYLPLFIGSDEDVCQIGVFHGLGKGDDPLVAVARCQVVEDLQGHVFDENLLPVCQVADALQRLRFVAGSDVQLGDGPAGLQGFGDTVAADDDICLTHSIPPCFSLQ